MSVNQISIFLENKPGTLHEMTQVLDESRVDMRALSLAETEGFGIVRIIVNDVDEAVNVLRNAGYVCRMVPVVIVSIPNEPGGLNTVLSYLKDAGVNLDYMYAMEGGRIADHALMIFRVSDAAKAERVLKAKNIRIVSQADIREE